MRILLLSLSGLLLAAPLAAQQRPAPFTIAESGRSFRSLAAAVRSIGDGEGTIRIAPGRYRECAVQEAGRVAFVAEQSGTAIFDGAICEGKAILVLRGRSARVEGLVFTHMEAEEGNGAGIRIERGDLNVSDSIFVDGESGILSAIDPSGTISVDRSTFSGLGGDADGDGVHSIYAGGYGAVRVTRTRFERATGGHYLKSRAPRIEVLDSSFDDSNGRNSNYLIDLPEGATGRIAGNIFVNGPDKENYGTMIAVAAERRANRSAGLVIEDNDVSLAPGFRWPTAFVGDWSGEPLTLRNNRIGPGIRPFARH
jgi:hypothetical protein